MDIDRYIKLTETLKRSGHSQTSFAALLGVVPSCVNHFMHGKTSNLKVARGFCRLDPGLVNQVSAWTGYSVEHLLKEGTVADAAKPSGPEQADPTQMGAVGPETENKGAAE